MGEGGPGNWISNRISTGFCLLCLFVVSKVEIFINWPNSRPPTRIATANLEFRQSPKNQKNGSVGTDLVIISASLPDKPIWGSVRDRHMTSIFARGVLFLSGYAPLFAIFSIQYYSQYGICALLPGSLGLIAVLGMFAWIRWVRSAAPVSVSIQNVRRKDAEVIAYIFAYVFPFLGLDLDNDASIIGLGVFFIVLMVLNVSSNMIHINPMLNLFGYHVYEIETDSDECHTIITGRSRLVRGTTLDAVTVGDEIWMEK